MKKTYITLMIATIIFSIISGILYVLILNSDKTIRIDQTTSNSFETNREQYLKDGEIGDVEGYALIAEGLADLGKSALVILFVGLVVGIPMVIIPFFTIIVLLILSIVVGILQIGIESNKKIKASRIILFICLIFQIINFISYSICVPLLFNIKNFIVFYFLSIYFNISYIILSIILNKKYSQG